VAAVNDSEDIVRYARPMDLHLGRVNGSAFLRRAQDEDGLSVSRPAVFGDGEHALVQIRSLARLKMKATGGLARVNVGRMKEVVAEAAELELQVVEDHLPAEGLHLADPSHALVVGLPSSLESPFNEVIGDLIAAEVTAVHPAV
jgi:hypothetical protein